MRSILHTKRTRQLPPCVRARLHRLCPAARLPRCGAYARQSSTINKRHFRHAIPPLFTVNKHANSYTHVPHLCALIPQRRTKTHTRRRFDKIAALDEQQSMCNSCTRHIGNAAAALSVNSRRILHQRANTATRSGVTSDGISTLFARATRFYSCYTIHISIVHMIGMCI